MNGRALLLIGRNSHLAREFAERHADLPLRAVGHAEADDPAIYEGVDCVVNFAFAPELHDGPYRAALDVDTRAARQAARLGIHYVLMSSRRVYPAAMQWNAAEDAPASGLDQYGRNKLRIEVALRELLGDRLSILRPGNVVGYEAVPGRRRFAAYLQNQLLQAGRIRLSISAQTRRDLVPVEFFCRVLREVMLRRIPGVFNVGAGRATEAGDAARWLIEGFGAAELAIESELRVDEFLLDSARIARTFGLACGESEVRRAFQDAGRRLAAAAAERSP